MESPNITPKFFMKSKGQDILDLLLMLTTVPRKFIIRLTGGCGNMSAEDAEGMYGLFTDAMPDFDGAMLYGGTRMLMRSDPSEVVPGITEVPCRLRKMCPSMISLGVVPRTQDLTLSDYGMIVEDFPEKNPYFTIVHPYQDIVLMTQISPNKEEVWDAEVDECEYIVQKLCSRGDFKAALIAYNGGTVTEREIRRYAKQNLPVIIVRGSGRRCDLLANDDAFLSDHPSVLVAEKDPASLRGCLMKCGAVKVSLKLVSSKTA